MTCNRCEVSSYAKYSRIDFFDNLNIRNISEH